MASSGTSLKLIIVNVGNYQKLIMTILLHYSVHITGRSCWRGRCAGRGRSAWWGAMTAPPRPIPTPCVKVCVVDGESGLCLGCFRTLKEIASWAALTDADRAELMAELPLRRSRIRPEKLALFS